MKVNKTPQRKLDSLARSRARRTPEQKAKAAEMRRVWKEKNKEKLQEYHRDYRAANRDRLNAMDQARQVENSAEIQLRRKGLDKSHADLVRAQRDGDCQICGGSPDGRWKRLCIDHCHATNRLRGFLCSSCNRGLGFFKDDPKLMLKAIDYLRASKTLPNENIT